MTKAREKRRHPSDQSGQATIEFALAMILLFAFVLFFVQLCLTMAFSSYIQYATFMSARAYLAAGPTTQDQDERAKAVLGRMIGRGGQLGTDRFPMIARGEGEQGSGGAPGVEIGPGSLFKAGDRNSSWMLGVRYTFKSRLFMLPLAGSGPGVNSVTFTSESWLGKEPSFQECIDYMGTVTGRIDNGC